MTTPQRSSIPTDAEPVAGISRRDLVSRGAAGGLGLVLAGSLDLLFGANAVAKPAGGAAGYGPLVPDPAGVLSLPEGFSYKIVAQSGVTKLESGEFTPSDPDGTAAFVRRGGNGSTLIMNHEISGKEDFQVPHLEGFTFDPGVGGGTTTLEVDKDGRRVREYVSLAGTLNNCAGGRTPWETWLSCEETEATIGGVPHGYVFEVDPHDREANRNPKPIKALGRFAHESVAVDPQDGNLYLTEDASKLNGLFYRFTPPPGAKFSGGGIKELADDAGTLEALRALAGDGSFVADLSSVKLPGTKLRTTWQNVPDRDARTTSVRHQAFAQPVTRSRKLEGMWAGDGGTYFVASFARMKDGSAAEHDGQVWFLDTRAQTIELKIIFVYTPADQDNDPDGPDNITVSPYGGVILAEDGEGVNHLVGSTASGETFFLARNELEGDNEFTGPTFSRNKKTLFANIQDPGHTFAITGPFTKQR